MKKQFLFCILILGLLGCGGRPEPLPIEPRPLRVETPISQSTRVSFTRNKEVIYEATLHGTQTNYDAIISELETRVATEAVDATAKRAEAFDTPYEYTSEQEGLAVDRESLTAALSAISGADDATIEVPTKPLSPAVTRESLQNEQALLASFTTSFDKSTLRKKNRVHNITLAASLLNGQVIEPNAVLSVNKTIGDRNKKNGYKTAAAIVGGKYEDEFGGGVCQVSSTLYNACLMADLEIVERYHHSWPMSYVPIGRDATISTGQKDLRIKNTTGAPLLILAQVDETNKTITFSLYGKKPEGYAYIEITSEKTGSIPAPKTKVKLEESLPAGTRDTERKSRKGQISETYKIYYDEQGNMIRKVLLYKDTYAPVQGIEYVSSDLY
ncbi:MAG: VanW family protein [Clostridiales bacterium]|nr:VanW family protein [Clostridiales bacterium]